MMMDKKMIAGIAGGALMLTTAAVVGAVKHFGKKKEADIEIVKPEDVEVVNTEDTVD